MRALACLVAVLSLEGQASATLPSNTCLNDNVASSPFWFPSQSTLDVWVSTYTDGNTVITPADATGLPLYAVESGVKMAIMNWNEEGGAAFRLRYRGTTTDATKVGAIVVAGKVCGFRAAVTGNAYLNGNWYQSKIEVRKYVTSDCQNPQNPGVWTTSVLEAGSKNDFVQIMQHELGHAAFNMGHPGEAEGPQTENFNCLAAPAGPVPVGTMSIMAAGYDPFNTRKVSNYDKEIVQLRYGQRSQGASFFKTQMRTGTSWYTPGLMTGTQPPYLRPLYRMSSMSQRTKPRYIGFIYGGTTGVQAGGAGQLDTVIYSAGAPSNWYGFGASDGTLGRPVALTSRRPLFGTDETIVFYFKLYGAGTAYNTEFGEICYRRSTDAGATYGAETCTGYVTRHPGLSATYDYNCGCFLVSYLNDSWQAQILTIPVSGSMFPVTNTNLTGVTSTHAPSIACGNVNLTGECMLVHGSTDDIGTFTWRKFSVNTSTGVVTSAGSGTTQSNVFAPYDTPSVVYNADDQTYRVIVANLEGSYSYKIAWNGSTWSTTAAVVLNSTTYNSPAVLSTRGVFSEVTRPYAWFVRYF